MTQDVSVQNASSSEAVAVETKPSTPSKIDVVAALDKHGVTLDSLIEIGKQGLTATRIVKDRDGDEIGTEPLWTVRYKHLALFLEMLGVVNTKSANTEVTSHIMTIEERTSTIQRLIKYVGTVSKDA